MDKEALRISKRMNLGICNVVDVARECYAKPNKSVREKCYMISFMWNSRNKADGHNGRGKKR